MSESRVVFEDLTKEGWTPHRLPGKGWLLLLDDDHQDPEESRAAWIDEKQFRTLRPYVTERPAPAPAAGPVIPPKPEYAPRIPAQHDAAMDEAVSLAKRAPTDRPAPAPEPELVELSVPDAVTAALKDAPGDGRSAAELVVATGRGKSQVYAALQELQDDGAVVRVGRGRYVLASAAAGEVTA